MATFFKGAASSILVHCGLLLFVFLCHAVSNYYWIKEDLTYRSYDAGPHMEAAAQAYSVAKQEGVAGLWRISRGEYSGIWPSTSYLPWVGMSLALHQSTVSLRLFNLLFLAIMLVSVYFIGRQLGNGKAGLLAATLTSLYPLLYGESRQMGMDFPGTAMVCLILALLLGTKLYTNTRISLLVGVCTGCAILLRPQSLFFVTLPLLVVFVLALLFPATKRRIHVIANASWAFVMAAITSSIWWFGRLDDLFYHFFHHHFKGQPTSSSSSSVFYLNILPWCASTWLVIIALVSLGGLCYWIRSTPGRWYNNIGLFLLIAWLGGGIAFLFLLNVHGARYLQPVLPALALVTSIGLLGYPFRFVRYIIVFLAISVATLSWATDSFYLNVSQYLGLGKSPISDTSGPPKKDPRTLAAIKIGEHLRKRHKDGYTVLLMYRSPHPDHLHFRTKWISNPVLRTFLPGITILGASHTDIKPSSKMHIFIGHAYLPITLSQPIHCYSLDLLGKQHSPLEPVINIAGAKLLEIPVNHPETQKVILRIFPWEVCNKYYKQWVVGLEEK